MALTLNTKARDEILDSGVNFDARELRIYSSPRPTEARLAPTGTLLRVITLPTPALQAASLGTKSKAGSWSSASGGTSGTAAWGRICDPLDDDSEDGDFYRIDGDISEAGQGGDLIIGDINIVDTDPVTISSFSVTLPGTSLS